VLDVACGLNPLTIPWMPLAPKAEYTAVDVAGSMMQFLHEYLLLVPVQGQAYQVDVLNNLVMRTSLALESMIKFPPAGVFDLALVLKTIPCLEQVDKSAGQRILENVRARYMLVSFPGRSLGGRSKGMVENYEAHFMDLIDGKNWLIRRYEFPGELAFRVEKPEFTEK
jgi:16S rRNA (guanine(1405)-N(7))-methyltransferase